MRTTGAAYCVSAVMLSACGGTSADPAPSGNGGATTFISNSGGAPGVGGTSTSFGGAASTSVTSTTGGIIEVPIIPPGLETCPVWASHKLLPTLGSQFYGPDPGPCTATSYVLTDAANPFSVVTYRYDAAGKVILADDPIGQGTTTYDWSGETLVRSTQIQIGGEQSVSVYEFGTGYVLDSVVNSPLRTQVRYSLSTNGYPLLQTYSSVTGVIQQYLFEYDGCQLKSMNRVRSTASGEPNATFEYDFEGHVSRVNVAGGTVVDYDYSCWN